MLSAPFPPLCRACSPDSCDTCDADGACLKCYDGYGLSADGQCVKCADGCNACKAGDGDATTCTKQVGWGAALAAGGTFEAATQASAIS